MSKKKQFSYYSFDKILSYNAVINMVMGARGLGKTYGAKRMVIKNALEKHEQFVYLRRYKPELKGCKTFFADIAYEFPEYEFRTRGMEAQYRGPFPEENDPWTTIGYFMALSVSASAKSIAFPDVTTIIFDEFIIETGTHHYLSNEVRTFLDFYSTVDRYDDRVRVLMLSNAISIMNPYFIEWKISPSEKIKRFGEGFVAIEFVDSERFGREVRNTRFGKFISKYNREYADYSIENEFKDDTPWLVMGKTGTATYMCTYRTKYGSFSVWKDGMRVFCQKKLPKGNQLKFSMCHDLRPGEVFVTHRDRSPQTLKRIYRQGRCFFDGPETREMFAELFMK